MIGGLPDNTAQAIGAMILHTVEALAAITLASVVLAIVFFVASRRTTSRRATLYRVLAVVLALVALVPPVAVLIAVGR